MSGVEFTVRAVDALVDAVAGKIAKAAADSPCNSPDVALTLATAFNRFAEGYALIAGVSAVPVTAEMLATLKAAGSSDAGG